jgi:uncharacterized alpha/beta hydrolase family protein
MQTEVTLTNLANTQIKHLRIQKKTRDEMDKRITYPLVIITGNDGKVTTRNGTYVQKRTKVKFTWKGLSLVVRADTEL